MIPVQKPSSHLKNPGKAEKVHAAKIREVTVLQEYQELIPQAATAVITMGTNFIQAKEVVVIITPGTAKNM